MLPLVRQTLIVLVGVAWVCWSTGCSVLTQRQVDAVKEFSKATENYGQLPGDVIRGYRDMVFMRQALQVGVAEDSETAKESLDAAVIQRDEVTRFAERGDHALRVLDDYSRVLTLLVSDNYTSDLNGAAQSLGGQLDSSIALYNSKFRSSATPLDSIGGIVAAVVRGGGGVWIRHRQGAALRDAVTRADPVVEEMTQAVEEIAGHYISSREGTTDTNKTIIGIEREQFRETFGTLVGQAAGRNQTVDLLVTERVVTVLDRATHTETLAALAKSSAIKYRAAHKKLVSAVKGDASNLEDVLAQIKALKGEVDAARKLQRQLEK